MSTSNFHVINASKVFAVTIEDEYDWDDIVSNLQAEFSIDVPKEGHSMDNTWKLGQFDAEKSFKGICAEVFVTGLIRSGYYSGASLDWEVEIYLDGIEVELDMLDIAQTIEGVGEDLSEKQAGSLALKVYDWIEMRQQSLVDKTEKLFAQYSTPLRCIGVASNGEAFYRAI